MIVSLFLFIVGLFLFRKKKLPLVTVLLWFGAGAGVTGWILSLFHAGAGWVSSALSWIVAGTAVIAMIAVWCALVLLHDLHPKNKGAAGKATAYAALFLPMIVTMLPGTFPAVILAIGHGIDSAGTFVWNRLF